MNVKKLINTKTQDGRMFLALGVAGLILLAGTDLSIGRMVGMGMTAATIIMHNGPNTGSVFGKVFDFTGVPLLADLAAEADTIARDGYNAAAEDFNTRVLGGFPAGILGTLTFVQPAEIFQ